MYFVLRTLTEAPTNHSPSHAVFSRRPNNQILGFFGSAVLGILPLVAACSRDSGLAPIAGRVTLDDKPVPNMIVNFTPLGETGGNGALGCTDDDGRFSLLDARGETGAYIGEYKVSFYPALNRNKPVDPALDVISVPSKAALPAIYLDPSNTPLRATVPRGGGTIDLLLTRTGAGAHAKTTSAPAK